MFRFKILVFYPALWLSLVVKAQNGGYQLPPKAVADMLLARPTPAVIPDSHGDWLILAETALYPSVEELARPEYRIAGLRINPANFAPSRQNFVNSISLKNARTGEMVPVRGLPNPLYAGNISWSPGEKQIAFTQTRPDRVDLYLIDVASHSARKINKTALNTVLGRAYEWMDDRTLLYTAILRPATAAPEKPLIPAGPAIQENAGKAVPRPTFQDLIKTPYDEELFAFFATGQLIKNLNGTETRIGTPAIYQSYSVSPDRQYLLLRTLQRPFSYAVPAFGFAAQVVVADAAGRKLKTLADLPSTETTPSGNDNVQAVPRGFDWRDDEPATLTWVEALDSGLIRRKTEYHDAVYALSAPFSGQARELFRTRMRFRGVIWGDARLAIVNEGLTGKQVTQMNRYDPSTGTLEKLFERNTTDAYGNPGFPVTRRNRFGREVLVTTDNGRKLLLNNPVGSSPKGDLPFLASYDLAEKKSDLLWRCPEGYFEYVLAVTDPENLSLITRRESEKQVPNFWKKELKLRMADRALTEFSDPYPQLQSVKKEKIKYKRADGVDLTGDLYLPAGYDKQRDGPLPVFIWAYPAEYNSAADAAQVRGSEHRFSTLNWGSPIFYVTQGYAVLNNAEMPIVATDTARKPNDDFVNQLRLNAEAAIEKLVSLGVGDRNRMAVGGHSYGAFMTANLLAHTSLFRAGIARSGAYNRTLTPFGFQNEDRTYWQAPEVYEAMSPFMYADSIKTPLLLVHGELDDNTGTFPIQSERFFNAIKGHGGTVRYISLPYEAHGYRGRENILHMLAEQNSWLEKYVKNAPASGIPPAPKAF